MRQNFAALCLAIVTASTVACSSKPEPKSPEPAPAPVTPPSTEPTTEKPGDDPARSDVNIDDAIKLACGLTETEAHFGYNSAKITDLDSGIMKKLAECFTTGKLAGRTMRLVGHADPRGEPEYNMVLGGRRADNVALAVQKAGLPASQVTTTSRGEMEARGTDEASWEKDRKVDIHLADAE